MSQQQERTTDSLTSVIQAIQKNQGTGQLRARQDDGLSTEIGSILFVNGQIIAAHVGSYQGIIALNILKTWGRSVFIFTQNTPPPPLLSQDSSPRQKLLETHATTTGPMSITTRQQSSGLSLTTIPRATMSIIKARGIIERAGFSRAYRQLILLIDGQRSLSELAVTIGCTPQDMQKMLQDLERLSVIRMSH